ncbi:MAG TPA: DMT family transporter [Candidatus Limnocylindria bacterium]|nr:DMT family transporter [Candidatus Limnocylindria bacterium]
MLFGLGSAAAFGTGDFSGGLAARRVGGLTVAGLAQAIGLVALIVLLAILRPAPPGVGVLAVAAVAGACGGLGLFALYAGLSLGSMGVVTALSGVGSVALPLLLGYLLDRAPVSPAQWLGVLVTMAAVAAASGATRQGVQAQAVGLGIAAAVFFGLWFFLLDVAAHEAGAEAWALVASRGSATVLIGGAALVRGRSAGLRTTWPIILLAGAMDVTGNTAFVLARSTLPVGVAAALSGIYPIVTMLLARAVLRESLPQLGIAAVILAVVGIAFISLG